MKLESFISVLESVDADDRRFSFAHDPLATGHAILVFKDRFDGIRDAIAALKRILECPEPMPARADMPRAAEDLARRPLPMRKIREVLETIDKANTDLIAATENASNDLRLLDAVRGISSALEELTKLLAGAKSERPDTPPGPPNPPKPPTPWEVG